MPEVLVIDDNAEILAANESYLSQEGFAVTVADSGVKAVSLISSRSFDCIVLDILLPDLDGYAICKAARTITDTPILFLSCLDEMDEKLKGLMMGGDDYMTKPYSLHELSARVHALIRRSGRAKENASVPNDDFYVERDQRLIHTKQQSVILSKKEFELFLLFYDNPGVLFSKEVILETIWETRRADPHTITVHITRLRKKIEFAESRIGRIESAYGSGYRLTPPDGARDENTKHPNVTT
jgi:DNA-binding response OmpR family regulator